MKILQQKIFDEILPESARKSAYTMYYVKK